MISKSKRRYHHFKDQNLIDNEGVYNGAEHILVTVYLDEIYLRLEKITPIIVPSHTFSYLIRSYRCL